MEVVLEFCVLVGDLKDGRMEEYQASPVLEALYASFRKKVSALVSRSPAARSSLTGRSDAHNGSHVRKARKKSGSRTTSSCISRMGVPCTTRWGGFIPASLDMPEPERLVDEAVRSR